MYCYSVCSHITLSNHQVWPTAECSRLCKQSHIGGATIAAPHQPEALDWCACPFLGRKPPIDGLKRVTEGSASPSSKTNNMKWPRNTGVFVQLGVNHLVILKVGTSFALRAVGPTVGRPIGVKWLRLMLRGIYRRLIRRKFQCEMHLIFHIKSVPGRLSALGVPNV